MKNIKYLFLLPLLLGMTSCDKPKDPTSGLTEYDKTVYVCFYIDYNRVDIKNPFKDFMWYPGVPLPLEEVPDMSGVEAPDGFSEFVGWSAHTIIDDLSDLWDFEKDTASASDTYLNLFGIWLAPGEIK
jgi:hypothetical protein